jgi:hypothetical protein
MQRNGASALTVLDSYEPMKLKYREAIVDFGGDQVTIYSLYINGYMIKCYLEDKKEEKHEYVDLSSHNWLVKEARRYKKDKKKGNGKKQQQQQVNELETAPTTVNTLENNIVSFETIPRKDVKKGKGGIE